MFTTIYIFISAMHYQREIKSKENKSKPVYDIQDKTNSTIM